MPSGSSPTRVSSSPAVKTRGRSRGNTGVTRRTVSAHIEYEVLPAYTSTPRPARTKRKTRSVEAGATASTRPKSHQRDKEHESNTVPRRKQQTGVGSNRHHRNQIHPRHKSYHGDQLNSGPKLEAYQPGLRAASVPPERTALSPNRAAATGNLGPYGTFPRNRGRGNNAYPYTTGGQRAIYPDPVSELLHAIHPPDLIYPHKGSVSFKSSSTPQQSIQENHYPSILNNQYTDANDNVIYPYNASNGSYATPGSLNSQSGISPTEALYPYPGLHVNTGNHHEVYVPRDTHSEGFLPSPRESEIYPYARRQGSQPLLSEAFDSRGALYAQIGPRTGDRSDQQGTPPTRPQRLDIYPSPEPVYSQPMRRNQAAYPNQSGNAYSPYGYHQQYTPEGHELAYVSPTGGSTSSYTSPPTGSPLQDYGSSPYSTLQSTTSSYRSPQAQYEHKGKLIDESHAEDIHNHWEPDGTLYRTHWQSYHWRIFPYYTGWVLPKYSLTN